MDDILSKLKEKATSLPYSPGVYLMKNSSGKIIYIGKAKALKNRVSQYFMSPNKHTEKVRQMVENVCEFDYIITDSEFEALILECNLIKYYSPKYNILLKDDKGYHYIKVSKGDWARVTAEKQKADDGSKYFGPYNSAWVVNQSVDRINKIFTLPTCNRKFKEGKPTGKPCLNFYIKQCCAPCMGKLKKSTYNGYIKEAIDYINGSVKFNIRDMKKEMMRYADNLEFEKAAKLRDRINAIKHLSDKQKFVSTSIKELDVIAMESLKDSICFVVFRFKDYHIYDKESFIIKSFESVEKSRCDFISQYYILRENIPPVILLDGETEDKDIMCELLSEKAKRKVKILIPQKGDLFHLVELGKKNAMEALAQRNNRTWKENYALKQLQSLLNLEKEPKIIESYDISNLAGTENVAGMVVFKNAKPFKRSYRRFKIKTVIGQDDYASMKEVIERRFAEYEKHKGENSGFGVLPDLILLDGGKGHIATIKPVLKKLGLNIPVFGMVKDSKHKTRAIATDGSEISINSMREAFSLVSEIQEEVHRFAISYHKIRRKKVTIRSQLLSIDGVGEKRAKNLLKRFKTIDSIKKADIEEISAVDGITKKTAENIYKFFRENLVDS